MCYFNLWFRFLIQFFFVIWYNTEFWLFSGSPDRRLRFERVAFHFGDSWTIQVKGGHLPWKRCHRVPRRWTRPRDRSTLWRSSWSGRTRRRRLSAMRRRMANRIAAADIVHWTQHGDVSQVASRIKQVARSAQTERKLIDVAIIAFTRTIWRLRISKLSHRQVNARGCSLKKILVHPPKKKKSEKSEKIPKI